MNSKQVVQFAARINEAANLSVPIRLTRRERAGFRRGRSIRVQVQVISRGASVSTLVTVRGDRPLGATGSERER